jgi:hypothetical protein
MRNIYTACLIGVLLSFTCTDSLAQTSSCLAPYDVNNPIMFVSSDKAKEYIINYRNKNKRKQNTHTKSVFLGRKNFCFIDNFFKSTEGANYSGINIHFAIYKRILCEGQSDPKEITFFLTPVQASNSESDFDAFLNFRNAHPDAVNCKIKSVGGDVTAKSVNHGELCPEKCDDGTDEWGEDPGGGGGGGGIAKTLTFSEKSPGVRGSVILLNPEDAKAYQKYYKNRFRFPGRKKHTSYIFLKKANFQFIADFFNDPANTKYEGVRIFFDSYNQKLLAHQAHEKQISLLMVPAYGNTGEPDFCAFINYFNNRSVAQNAPLKEDGQVIICGKNCIMD